MCGTNHVHARFSFQRKVCFNSKISLVVRFLLHIIALLEFLRACSFQLYASGILLRDGICVGHLPQFALKQSVSLFVTQMRTVSFVVDQKIVFEYSVAHRSGMVSRIAVCYGGEGDSIVGPQLADVKGLFTIELLHSSIAFSQYPISVVQAAMQKHFPSLSDRLNFASFAHVLSSTLSPAVLKQNFHGLSMIQVRSSCFF